VVDGGPVLQLFLSIAGIWHTFFAIIKESSCNRLGGPATVQGLDHINAFQIDYAHACKYTIYSYVTQEVNMY